MDAAVQIQLGPTYSPDMWDLRKRVAAARGGGARLVFATLRAPITSDIIDVALESGSLYLIGIRVHGGTWFEFAPDSDGADAGAAGPPGARLAGSRWIMAGSEKALSTYRALRLPWMLRDAPGARGAVSFAGRPADLLRLFRHWDGRIDGHHVRIALCALIFVVCEALRFRSVETLCRNWTQGYSPAGGVMTEVHVLTITTALLDAVQNWNSRARAGDSDVWTWLPGQPDLLIE